MPEYCQVQVTDLPTPAQIILAFIVVNSAPENETVEGLALGMAPSTIH